MADRITYAKSGGPPGDWHGLLVIDLETGAEVDDVHEVNAAEGWVIRAERNDAGQLFLRDDAVAMERLEGRFEIRRPA